MASISYQTDTEMWHSTLHAWFLPVTCLCIFYRTKPATMTNFQEPQKVKTVAYRITNKQYRNDSIYKSNGYQHVKKISISEKL